MIEGLLKLWKIAAVVKNPRISVVRDSKSLTILLGEYGLTEHISKQFSVKQLIGLASWV